MTSLRLLSPWEYGLRSGVEHDLNVAGSLNVDGKLRPDGTEVTIKNGRSRARSAGTLV